MSGWHEQGGAQEPPQGWQQPPPGWQGPPPGWPAPPPAWPPAWPPRPITRDDTTWAMLAHLSFFMLAIVGPLVIMLTRGQHSPYVRHQAVEALNFHITFTLAMFASVLLLFVLVGIVLIPIVAVSGLVFTIQATIAANRGEPYRYPVSIRLVH